MSARFGVRLVNENLSLNMSKNVDFRDWYKQLVTKSELIDDYNLPGFYILRPWAFSIWETVQKYMVERFQEIGVKNISLPLFAPFMDKLEERYEDLFPNTYFLTHAGKDPIKHSIAIRPTSESLVYSDFGRWCRSWRDLPFRINHWSNALRWIENPIPFIYSREFLLQEGYSGFTNREESIDEVYKMLDIYNNIYSDLFAIPVLKGRKSEKGKLKGSDFSASIQIIEPNNGIGIQAASSTHLGQNFSKKFSIYFDNPKSPGEKEYIWLTRYTLSIRSIGALVMTFGDDFGLILPPKLAPIQVVIIPVGLDNCKNEKDKFNLIKNIKLINEKLKESGLRVEMDIREELKGVPIQLEIGLENLISRQIPLNIRFYNEKCILCLDNLASELKVLLKKIQSDMLKIKAKELNDSIEMCLDWELFISKLERHSILLSPFCGHLECEESIQLMLNLKGINSKLLNIPFEQPKDYFGKNCINPKCKEKVEFFALFGQSIC
uniref:Aminoacyl-transfer RNA synthetases class-II family profile domain-containing protein n=1 Tax=Meloidogyne incognita TaxID=6306 RepID=A0A914MCS8_MELIC